MKYEKARFGLIGNPVLYGRITNAKRPPRNQKIYEKGACNFFLCIDFQSQDTVNCQPTTVNYLGMLILFLIF